MAMRMMGFALVAAALLSAPVLVSHGADAAQGKEKEICQSKQSKQGYASGWGKTKEVALQICFAKLQANAAALYGSSAHLKEKIPSATGLGEKCSKYDNVMWQCRCSAVLCGYLTNSANAPGSSLNVGPSSRLPTKSLLVPRQPPPTRHFAPSGLRRR
jgi:purine-cytosine permease-like protein